MLSLVDPKRPRSEAEAIEEFGDELAGLNRTFDRLVQRMSPAAVDRINAIAHQEHLDAIAQAFRALGAAMCAEADEAEEAEDRRRANPLEPDFRRIA